MSARTAEASAPCRVDLAGGEPGSVVVTVALDRRAWARVEAGVSGVEIESKDAPSRARGRDVEELLETGTLPLAARVLRALGVKTGVRVVTQSRVPPGSGLGEGAALAVAVVGAAARALDRRLGPDEIANVAAEALGPDQEAHTAVLGGVLALHPEGGRFRPERLHVDPARIEESLLLLDGGVPPSEALSRGPVANAPEVSRGIRAALLEGRIEELIGLWAEEAGAVGEAVRAAGGASRVCGAGRGRIVAAWAPPGSRGPGIREAVVAAAKAAGLRIFQARVDLRGLDVE